MEVAFGNVALNEYCGRHYACKEAVFQALVEVAVQYHHDLESATRAMVEKDEAIAALAKQLEQGSLRIKRHVQRIGRDWKPKICSFEEILLSWRMSPRAFRQLGRETHSMRRRIAFPEG
jgi:AcrR family transcriptional regulator